MHNPKLVAEPVGERADSGVPYRAENAPRTRLRTALASGDGGQQAGPVLLDAPRSLLQNELPSPAFPVQRTTLLIFVLAGMTPPLLLLPTRAVHLGLWLPFAVVCATMEVLAARLLLRGTDQSRVYRVELTLRVLLLAPTVTLVLLLASRLFGGATTAWYQAALTAASVVGLLTYLAVVVCTSGRPGAFEVQPRLAPGGSLPLLCRLVKRALDLIIVVPTLLLAAPVMFIAAVAIAVESPGGWLFGHTRLGVGGKPFRMLKLRTMLAGNDDREHQAYVAALVNGEGPAHGGLYKLVGDPRRTRVGTFLRQLSIDELPQLFNVLKGDMSLVGPRPPTEADAALYNPRDWDRLAVKPGITGLWQVKGRSRLSFTEMVHLDLRYCRDWTPLLDLKILLLTPKAALWDRETA